MGDFQTGRKLRGKLLAHLVTPSRRYFRGVSPTEYLVPGSLPWVNYDVDWEKQTCTCPDYQKHNPEGPVRDAETGEVLSVVRCKHLWAVYFYRHSEEVEMAS